MHWIADWSGTGSGLSIGTLVLIGLLSIMDDKHINMGTPTWEHQHENTNVIAIIGGCMFWLLENFIPTETKDDDRSFISHHKKRDETRDDKKPSLVALVQPCSVFQTQQAEVFL